ncbi:MAG: Uma2 family endonuclease [Plectolyngbya sp. WJT66-NPBG17]|jgi:Uma2 family endonuclease|nr:Uma2 family endonuclease [Plectolyngbya sp. WJT66-NPBG17]
MQPNLRFPATNQKLPTMYDLPSEDPEESGLPDEFHDIQPHLLSQTLRLVDYGSDRIFTGTDTNLYYAPDHPRWHKRPDWFLVVDVPRLYHQEDLRNSYVVWDEGKSPSVVVELLSPRREFEDLGAFTDELIEEDIPHDLPPYTIEDDETGIKPPHKMQVYGEILQVPYYFVFSRYSNRLRFFQLNQGRYQEQRVDRENPRVWLPLLGIGLGVWYGEFDGITRSWIRWYDANGNWIPNNEERILQEQQLRVQEQRAREQAESQLRQVALNLLQSGMPIEQAAQLTGLSEATIRKFENQSL